MSKSNIPVIFQTDAYKLGHKVQQDAVTDGKLEFLYSNFTNRSSREPGVNHVVHFGLQAFIQEFILDGFGEFFAADVEEVVAEYQEMLDDVFGPNNIGTEHIRALHNLGYIPIRFAGLPEGTLVPLRVPSFTVENTHPDFAWLTNYLESVLSASYWHMATVATRAWNLRRLINRHTEAAGIPAAAADFMLHDFSFRGQTSPASAAASGAGHLLSSLGSDTIPSYRFIRHNYAGDNGMIMGSVPASEHSIMCLGTQPEFTVNGDRIVDETETYRKLIEAQPDGAIVSIVSDTYSLFDVLDLFRPEADNGLYALVTGRAGTVVYRPDSGQPVKIVAGDPDAPEGSRERKGVFEILADIFGTETNEKGLQVLNPRVGVIYGDSMNYERIDAICTNLVAKGYAPSVVYGIGSFNYQYVTRDTFGSAVKATWAQIGGVGTNLLKDPITDDGTKKSATGRLAVRRMMSGELGLIEKATPEQEAVSELATVFEDGEWFRYQSFADVRKTLWDNTALLENLGRL